MCVCTHLALDIIRYLMHGSGVIFGNVAASVKNKALQVITSAGKLCRMVWCWVKGFIPSALVLQHSRPCIWFDIGILFSHFCYNR